MFEKFIHRPVLAIVCSVATVLLGLLAMQSLPISQYPAIAPPQVLVELSYPGASAQVLVKSTLIPLARAINGVPGMKYMITDATSAGEATIEVMFELGTDPNAAVVKVKNRVDQVRNLLPELVNREGIIVHSVQRSMLMYVNLYSDAKEADQKYAFNYADVFLLPALHRIPGVGHVKILGNRLFAMRVWLKPDRMRAYNVSTDEVMAALAEQSVVGRPGRTGQATGRHSQAREYVLVYQGRFNTPEQYGDIILRATPEGELLRLKDVADVTFESEFYDIYSNLSGRPSAAIIVKQNYGSNASKVITAVKAKLKELERSFPPGMKYEINYDVSKFLDASNEKVVHTLGEAFVLVALVVFVFLGDWRSTLIPTLAIPVSLVGAFIFILAFGFTINLVTLFALVLAIGIVVDNAIVVVEAVHAKMEEERLSPYKAVVAVLGEISGAIIAITIMMTAVFVPIAFLSGPVGVFYRQFSITMASSIVLSGVVALTLTPVLCAMVLKAKHEGARHGPIGRCLDAFDHAFQRFTGGYVKLLRLIVPRRLVTLLLFVAMCVGLYAVQRVIPSGFIPSEDQGQIYAIVQMPPGTTLERTNQVIGHLQQIAEKVEGVQSVSSLAGYEILTEGRGSNAGTCLINLKSWEDRTRSVRQIIEELEEKSKDLGAVVEYFEPPVVPGYGAAGGIAFRLLDKTNTGDYQALDKVTKDFMAALRKRKELTGLFTFYAANYPQYELVIDNKAAMQKGVSIGKALDNLDILIGSTYEQGFIRFERFWKVYVQADAGSRRLPTDLLDLYVKNDHGEMVPYAAFMTMKPRLGPNEITQFNLYNSAAIRAVNAPGFTTGEAINVVKEVAAQTLPRGYDIGWEGITFDQVRRGNEALYIFLLVIAFVYLVLAAQYESFLLPLAVILPLPAGALGSFALLKVMGLANDIYAQVGIMMLVGLLGKNAVLIVEFAIQEHDRGRSILDAAIAGAQVRFRAILMTSFACIVGLIPLLLATGPGAVGNRTIGASALGGMFVGTVLGVVVVPGLYYIFAKLGEGRALIRDEEEWPLTEKKETGVVQGAAHVEGGEAHA